MSPLPNDGSCYLVFAPGTTECWQRVRAGASPTPGRCNTCAQLRGYVTFWCKSADARAHFGTSIPGRENCLFWKEPPQDGPPVAAWWRALLFGPVEAQ